MTQQDKAAPQAAGAVSIDSDEFHNLVSAMRRVGPNPQESYRAMLRFIDAHAAQRYEAGRNAGIKLMDALDSPLLERSRLRAEAAEASLARQQKQWDAIAAANTEIIGERNAARTQLAEVKASLARLVEGVEKAVPPVLPIVGFENEGRAALLDQLNDLLALLPAKAESGETSALAILREFVTDSQEHDVGGGDVVVTTCEVREKAVKLLDSLRDPSLGVCGTKPADCPNNARCGCATLAPAPAMGEELPPLPKPDCYYVEDLEYGREYNTADEFSGARSGGVKLFTSDQMRTYGRACMALRQPGAGGVQVPITKGWCERMAKLEMESDSNIEAGAPANDTSEVSEILRDMLAIQGACGLHTDEYAPGSVIEYIKELEADAATAPVSQPGAHPVVGMLLNIAHAAYDLMDNTEESGARGDTKLTVQHDDFSTLSDAMDKLDALADDQPGIVMGPAAKAAWAMNKDAPPAAPVSQPAAQEPVAWRWKPGHGDLDSPWRLSSLPLEPGADRLSEALYTAPQPIAASQTPVLAELSDAQIRDVFLSNGFTIKEGHSDLKPYVYAAVRAILAAAKKGA